VRKDVVRHTVGKFSTRTTTLIETSSQSEVAPKVIVGVPGQKAIWMWAPWRGAEYTIRGKVVASPKSGPW